MNRSSHSEAFLARAVMRSPIGLLRVDAAAEGLRSIHFQDRPLAALPGNADAAALLAEALHQLQAYFDARLRTFDLPLAPQGTPFQLAVWSALGEIPYGQTRSYADVARAVGAPTAVRAVGAANGRNPLALVRPCHRVIGKDGSLTGFAGGLAMKRWLLDFEARAAAADFSLA